MDGFDELIDPGPQLAPTGETVHVGKTAVKDALGAMTKRWTSAQQPGYATAAAKEVSVTPSSLHHVAGGEGHGMEWGTVIHFLLETIMREPDADRHALARMALEEQGLDPARAAAVVSVVEQVTASEIWLRAQNSKRRLVEVPFVAPITAEESAAGLPTVVRGVIDLAFEEQEGWVIVDYKTDVVTEDRLQPLTEHYQGQIETYASVWQEMLGQRVHEKGLYFTSSGQYITV